MEVERKVQNWLLQNLSDVLNRDWDADTHSIAANTAPNKEKPSSSFAEFKAEQEWQSSIAAIERLLLSNLDLEKISATEPLGLVFSAPAPIFSHSTLLSRLQTGVFTPDVFQPRTLMLCQKSSDKEINPQAISPWLRLPLLPNDPIVRERFCLVLTANFGAVLLLGRDRQGLAQFYFSFTPETITGAWLTLRSRLVLTNYPQLSQLDNLIEKFTPPIPDYRVVSNFSRLLLESFTSVSELPQEKTRQIETIAMSLDDSDSSEFATTKGKQEMELLQALTHEIRTPLTTIRTLTKLLLKRKDDFQQNVVQRLQAIDRECTEQIDRMELIFRAAELESTNSDTNSVQLVHFSLEHLFQQSIPRWQKQAQRRNVRLEVTLPPTLPQIVSDPAMLDRVLTGLVESCTRSMTMGGEIHLKVATAGDRLKLQVLSQHDTDDNPFKALGQLLMFQPETGCLSLNRNVTKNLFQVLGGKLTVRQRSKQGEELTIFLPLGNSTTDGVTSSLS
jgi:signal transduction histidine kinase